ncbi:hypothetical protein M408DRAFT_20108 [Serendipita vermifera MAFF 305830]|uniref:protein-histidine N-methyltransferase n=1 Tax=Serendipita vermifera MAFF 305830 TaxID=933852 RepID=A0A0C2XV38_SERVB|nr:hypothetical protein M408DRAFT_20108 [Serendipita vermifera MAFF 305830]
MFKFNFGKILDYPLELEEDDQDATLTDDASDEIIIVSPRTEQNQPQDVQKRPQDACEEVSLDDLMKTLSPVISYTPLVIKSRKRSGDDKEHSITLPRRDLYDARFQIISEGALSSDSESEEEEDLMEVEETRPPLDRHNPPTHLDYIDAPSDLIPDIYEGGLKTWECSIDVVEYLSQLEDTLQGKTMLEVGCGTAIPSAYLLQTLFSSTETPSAETQTILHMQDYNKSVLELVTLPNLILAWYSSLAAHPYRTNLALPTADPSSPGELSITPELIHAFHESLNTYHIHLRFWAGAWSTFEPRPKGTPAFDIIITSETIYRSVNVSSLLTVLRSASVVNSESTQQGFFAGLMNKSQTATHSLVLVAAKVLYFGVGGSVDEFKGMAERAGATVHTVLDIEMGVGRRILKLEFTS